MAARAQRLLLLAGLVASLELLERIAYRAGVTDAAAAADRALAELRDDVDDLDAFDVTDVLAFHGYVTS